MRARLSRTTLLGALGAVLGATACTGDADDDVARDPICEDGKTLSVLESVRVKAKLDFLGRAQAAFKTNVVTFIERSGEVCATAKDRKRCESTVEAAAGDNAGLKQPGIHAGGYYVATRGDQVFLADTPAKLGSLIAPVDDPNGALFLVRPSNPSFTCAEARIGKRDGATLVTLERQTKCANGDMTERQFFQVSPDGIVTLLREEREAPPNGCTMDGRLHEDQPLVVFENDGLGEYLARGVYFEAGSVDSFLRLSDELEAHGAPASLAVRARRAAADEVRHADLLRELAGRHGVTTVFAPPPAPRHVRTLAAIAEENAVEGGVREAFAALVALHQAARATDPTIKRVMQSIAADEIRHAELAWDIERWTSEALDDPARTRVANARSRAIVELLQMEAKVESAAERALLGLPDEGTMRALGRALAERLEASSAATLSPNHEVVERLKGRQLSRRLKGRRSWRA